MWQPGMPLPPGVKMAPAAEPKREVKRETPVVKEHITAEDSTAKRLKELMQDEHNAARFYSFLSETTEDTAYSEYMKTAGAGCVERRHQLNKLYFQCAGVTFVPADTELNTRVSFDIGVNWAITVESREVEKLSLLYENATDDKFARVVFAQITRKIAHMIRLMLIILKKEL